MRWKSTLVLLLATIGIGFYVSLVELKQPTVEEREELAREVARLDEDAITRLDVTGPAGAFTLAKESDAWRLTSPRTARADATQVRRLLYHLDPVESERALADKPDKPLAPADFGLEPPKGSLTATDGTRTITLLFGDKTPVGDFRYLKLQDKPVIYVAGNRLFDAVDEPWDSYRSRSILDIDAATVTALSANSPSSAYTLRKEGERWMLASPVEDTADGVAAASILSKAQGLYAEQFVSDEPTAEQRATWGLEPALSTLTLTVENREQPIEIRVGHALGGRPDELHVMRADEPSVYSVKKSAFEEIWKDANALRKQEILELSPDDITKAQVAWQGASWTIERQDGGWRVAESGVKLDDTKVQDWLWKLREFKLARFVEEAQQDPERYGLADAPGAIRVWTTDRADAKEVLIGNPVDEGRSRYARLSERRGAIVELPEGIELILATTPATEFGKAERESPEGEARGND